MPEQISNLQSGKHGENPTVCPGNKRVLATPLSMGLRHSREFFTPRPSRFSHTTLKTWEWPGDEANNGQPVGNNYCDVQCTSVLHCKLLYPFIAGTLPNMCFLMLNRACRVLSSSMVPLARCWSVR